MCIGEWGVHLAVHLPHASVSCLGDGHYGSCYCLCVRSAGITEVLELTSLGCRQRMHKWDFVLKALDFGFPVFSRNRREDGTICGDRLGLCATRMRWLHVIILLMIYTGEASTWNWMSYTDVQFLVSCPYLPFSLILFHCGSDLCRLWDVLHPGRYVIFLVIVWALGGYGA